MKCAKCTNLSTQIKPRVYGCCRFHFDSTGIRAQKRSPKPISSGKVTLYSTFLQNCVIYKADLFQMKVKVIWLPTVFPKILLNVVAAFAVDENSLSRSAYFTTRQNKKLMGHVVQRFESLSLMSCSHSCMRNTWCSSTNFEQLTGRGDKGTCELNKHDISTVNEDSNFQDQHGSTFSLHLKVII